MGNGNGNGNGNSNGKDYAFDISKLRVKPGAKIKLAKIDPSSTPSWDGNDKSEAAPKLAELNGRLESLQNLLFAQGKERVLVVLQAMDAGGKDGTIRRVFEGVNPAGVRVASFKAPTEPERARDYLWRIHQQVPEDGELVIFNRSHYEDVLVVRVNSLVPEARWSRRYAHIAAFEQMLVDEGTTIVKLLLHISKDEQRKRLQDRINDPEKNWKFNPADLDTRAHWDDYMKAFDDAIAATSTEAAPWYIVPANRKWYRNLAVSEILVKTLEGLKMTYPAATADVAKTVIPQ